MYLLDQIIYGLLAIILVLVLHKTLMFYGPKCCRLEFDSRDGSKPKKELLLDYQHKVMAGFAFLAFCTQASPFVGLSATLVHVIEALAHLGEAGENINALAVPLGNAMFSTLWGIVCALIAGFGHHMLGAKADKLIDLAEVRLDA